MDLESHATPTTATPQQRYAALHRALERGLTSDAIWKELAEVSYALGHLDESARCAQEIENRATRMEVESRLARRQNRGPRPAPTAAPAASHAGRVNDAGIGPRQPGPGSRVLEEAEIEPGLRGHLIDAMQFLLHQHMPWLCLVTMLAFPVVIGVGGFLTSGTSAVLLAAISALPGACVLAVILAMGRRILVEGSNGEVDAPAIPEIRLLGTEAALFVRDLVIVGLALAIPLGIGVLLGLSLFGLVTFALIGMAGAPMAFCLRQLRGDTASLSPLLIGQAVCKGGPGYLAVAGMCWAMALPLVAVACYVAGQPVWLQIAAIGPTAVLPVFLSMRLLGTWLDANFDRVGQLLGMAPRRDALATGPTVTMGQRRSPPAKSPAKVNATAKPAQPVPPSARAARSAAPSAAAAPTPAPQVKPTAQPPAHGRATPRPQAAAPARSGTRTPPATPSQPAASRPAAKRPEPQQQPRRQPAPRAVRAIEGRQPQAPRQSEPPDLTALPGAVTVSGRDRVRLGAASRR